MKKLFFICLILRLVVVPAYADVPKSQVESPAELVSRSDKPDALIAAYARAEKEGKRYAVLNSMRIGVDALQLGYNRLAEKAFDEALFGIETVYANNEIAAKARSVWYEESVKDFKGEPYERAMAYYYRGLLFLKSGDFDNARAAFKSAILQDSFAEEDQNRCDFALMIFLEGWASMLAGDRDMADALFKELSKFKPDFKTPEGSNILVVIETGTSPRKVSDGPGHAELKFRKGRNFTETRAELDVNGVPFGAYLMEDIYWQASSRGGRPIDKILAGKVHFRQTTEKIGTTLTDISSASMILSSGFQNAGGIQAASGALALVGIVNMALAANARPNADTRYWDNLPDTVHVYTGHIPQGNHQIKVRFKDEKGNYIPELEQSFAFTTNEPPSPLVWIRSRQQLSSAQKK